MSHKILSLETFGFLAVGPSLLAAFNKTERAKRRVGTIPDAPEMAESGSAANVRYGWKSDISDWQISADESRMPEVEVDPIS